MKKTRHRKIVEIIEKRDVETQEELAGYSSNSWFCCDTGYRIQRYQRTEAVQSTHRWRQTEIRHFKTG